MKRFFLIVLCLLLACTGALAQSEPLFQPSGKGNYNNYCPSIFEEDGVTHIYYCVNPSPNYTRDNIGYRTSLDGGYHFSDQQIVLDNDADRLAWDGTHICDPDVIKGVFHLDGEEYHYLMAYLGCLTKDCTMNEIGIAVAKHPAGPWVKVEHLNPIVPYEKVEENWKLFQWGTGWATLVSLDQAGKVMMLYRYHNGKDILLMCEKWDLSDLNHAQRLGDPIEVKKGAVGRGGLWSELANIDMVYDAESGMLYCVSDGGPFRLDTDAKNSTAAVAAGLCVYRYTEQRFGEDMIHFFEDQKGQRWEKIGGIEPEDTGYPRNHNAGLLGDPYGWKLEGDTLEVFFAISEYDSFDHWSYRIHRKSVPLE